ncbi:MAG: hypothetical protein H6736_11805 [Alphaproteobacteria bacterium]|nr:hypothetical protein [Alphaproteobacteria bacterium]MCB9692488.1 hypothetical protein [Alphaproteobacteria bacterium]
MRYAMGRGLPAQVAEDVVFGAWEKARKRHDPAKGTIEALMRTIVRDDCAYWWRTVDRDRRLHEHLKAVEPATPTTGEVRQMELIEALSEEERSVFAAWALQKHLGKGRVRAEEVGASIGLDATGFENAKRRLKGRLHGLLAELGWSVQELFGRDG